MAAVHDRACGHRSLLPAGRTFPARPATLQFPAPVMAAGGADEAVEPALGCEMRSAGGFIGKARLEGGAGHRAIVLPAAGHDRTLSEHFADGNRKPNMSSNRVQRDKPFVRFLDKWRKAFEIRFCYFDDANFEWSGSILSVESLFAEKNLVLLPDSYLREESVHPVVPTMDALLENHDAAFAYMRGSDPNRLSTLGALTVAADGGVAAFLRQTQCGSAGIQRLLARVWVPTIRGTAIA